MALTNRSGYAFEAPKTVWQMIQSSSLAALLAGAAAGFAIGLVEVLS